MPGQFSLGEVPSGSWRPCCVPGRVEPLTTSDPFQKRHRRVIYRWLRTLEFQFGVDRGRT